MPTRARVNLGAKIWRTWSSRLRIRWALLISGAPRLRGESGVQDAIRQALRRSLVERLDPDERAVVARIEDRRAELKTLGAQSLRHGSSPGGRTTVAQLTGQVSIAPAWGRILMRIIRATKPTSALELGTALGISGAYQAAGLALNGGGRLTTIELNPERTQLACEGIEKLGFDNVDFETGSFDDVLGSVLERVAPIDYAFIDGHHDEIATQRYFDQIAGRATSGAVIVLDDIPWSEGMRKAWRAVAADPRVDWSRNLGRIGICVLH
jgi:predicted O-methyltransferase YrrM